MDDTLTSESDGTYATAESDNDGFGTADESEEPFEHTVNGPDEDMRAQPSLQSSQPTQSTVAPSDLAAASAVASEDLAESLAKLRVALPLPPPEGCEGGLHWTCQIDGVSDAQLSATYSIGQHSMVQRFAVRHVSQRSLRCHAVLKEPTQGAQKLSELLPADWQPDPSLAGDSWACVARECVASGGDVADEKHSMRTIEGVIEQRRREEAAQAQKSARLRQEQQQEEVRQREEAARAKRKAEVVRDGLTLYDCDFHPVDWQRRGRNGAQHCVFYPDGVMGEVVGYREDRDGSPLKPCFLTIPWASKVTRGYEHAGLMRDYVGLPGNLPSRAIDGFSQEDLSEIRIAALSLSMVDGHQWCDYANLPRENWWQELEPVQYRYSPYDEWRDIHLLMQPCDEHPGYTMYRPRGRAWSAAELEPLGMAWLAHADPWRPRRVRHALPRRDQVNALCSRDEAYVPKQRICVAFDRSELCRACGLGDPIRELNLNRRADGLRELPPPCFICKPTGRYRCVRGCCYC
jgi:hypothetical protein